MKLKKHTLAFFLIVPLLISGCGDRKFFLESDPSGAKVFIGKKSYLTPCTLSVSEKIKEAVFVSPKGAVIPVALPDKEKSSMTSGLARTGNISLKMIGYPLLIAGGACLITACALAEGGKYEQDTSAKDDDLILSLFGIGGVSAATGILLNQGAENLEDYINTPKVIHVTFPEEKPAEIPGKQESKSLLSETDLERYPVSKSVLTETSATVNQKERP